MEQERLKIVKQINKFIEQEMLPTVLQNTSYIFLDIDGVLNTYRHRLLQEEATGDSSIHNWCPQACHNLLKLCREYDIHIIISSNWKDQYELEEIRRFFEKNGVPSDNIIDKTPSEVEEHKAAEYRGLEIQQWLNKNAPDGASYVIIDDESTILSAQKDHFVRVDPEEGLADPEAIAKVREILSNGEK